jgi:hypothetical protein
MYARQKWNPEVTQVCSFWRETALRTPCLWNRMDSKFKELSIRLHDRFQIPVHICWRDRDYRPGQIKSVTETDTYPHEFSQVFKHPARILSIDITAKEHRGKVSHISPPYETG